MPFYDKDMMKDFKKSQSNTNLEKLLLTVGIPTLYYFVGYEVAILVALAMVCYSLVEIKMLLHYQNFMTGKSIGLHDL